MSKMILPAEVNGSDTPPNMDRHMLLATLPSHLIQALLSLLVVICGLLGPEEHKRLGETLWERGLDDKDKHVVASVSCLVKL